MGVSNTLGSHWRVIAAGTALLGLALVGEMGVASGAANLLPNGTFEGTGAGSLKSWSGMNASLALAADGVGGGHAARVTFTSGGSAYSINASPKPVASTTAGTRYVAQGMFRSDTPGQTICFRLKEANSSNVGKGQGQQCAVATTAWQAFPEVDYTSVATGDSIALRIFQQANAASGQSFEVDSLSLNAGSADTTPPSIPAGVAATAVRAAGPLGAAGCRTVPGAAVWRAVLGAVGCPAALGPAGRPAVFGDAGWCGVLGPPATGVDGAGAIGAVGGRFAGVPGDAFGAGLPCAAASGTYPGALPPTPGICVSATAAAVPAVACSHRRDLID